MLLKRWKKASQADTNKMKRALGVWRYEVNVWECDSRKHSRLSLSMNVLGETRFRAGTFKDFPK